MTAQKNPFMAHIQHPSENKGINYSFDAMVPLYSYGNGFVSSNNEHPTTTKNTLRAAYVVRNKGLHLPADLLRSCAIVRNIDLYCDVHSRKYDSQMKPRCRKNSWMLTRFICEMSWHSKCCSSPREEDAFMLFRLLWLYVLWHLRHIYGVWMGF